MVNVHRGEPLGPGRRVAIAVAQFNEPVTERLLAGALRALAAQGVSDDDITVAWVPGAFELPLACRWLAQRSDCDAVIALGAVIRGETGHYDWVCHAATDGSVRVGLDTGTPVAFGVLTCDTLEQAMARAGGLAGNKGADAAMAALSMIDLHARIVRGGHGAKGGAAG